MERLTHEADFGLEDWGETLFFVKSDPNGAYNILDIAKYQGEPEFDEILKNVALRLAAYEDTDLEPQLVQLLADAICGKTGVFCPKCGDGLCLAAGKNGLQIGCFGCGEYVPVKELFEVYRAMKERERTWNG